MRTGVTGTLGLGFLKRKSGQSELTGPLLEPDRGTWAVEHLGMRMATPPCEQQLGRSLCWAEEGLGCVSKAGDSQTEQQRRFGAVTEPAKPLNNTGTPCSLAFLKSPAADGSGGGDQRFLRIKSTCGARWGGG